MPTTGRCRSPRVWRPRAGRTHPQQPWRHAPAASATCRWPGALPARRFPLAGPPAIVQLESMVINNTGIAYKQLGDFRRALESYNSRWCSCRKLGNPSNEAQLLNNIGNITGRRAKAGGVSWVLRTGAVDLPPPQAQPGEAMVLNNMGSAYYQLGPLSERLGPPPSVARHRKPWRRSARRGVSAQLRRGRVAQARRAVEGARVPA